jgi:hypothetical protein
MAESQFGNDPIMSDGAENIGRFLDPGPELPSYDPAWEARWDAADMSLRLTSERDPGGASDLSRRLVAELCQAAEARFWFAWDLEAHLAWESAGTAERAGIPLPLIAGSATLDEMLARHEAFRALCARSRLIGRPSRSRTGIRAPLASIRRMPSCARSAIARSLRADIQADASGAAHHRAARP